jgi:hypothetical protein
LLFDYIKFELGIIDSDNYEYPKGRDLLINSFGRVDLNITKSSNIWFSTQQNVKRFKNMGILKFYVKSPLGNIEHADFGRGMYLLNKYQSMWIDAAMTYRELHEMGDSLKLFFTFNFELKSGFILLDYSIDGVDVAPLNNIERGVVYDILYNDNYVD